MQGHRKIASAAATFATGQAVGKDVLIWMWGLLNRSLDGLLGELPDTVAVEIITLLSMAAFYLTREERAAAAPPGSGQAPPRGQAPRLRPRRRAAPPSSPGQEPGGSAGKPGSFKSAWPASLAALALVLLLAGCALAGIADCHRSPYGHCMEAEHED